ncbi:MAG: SGNH/GDSL hydrolase family protein [Actinomycetota bacterium]
MGGFVVLIVVEVLLLFRRDFPLKDPEQPVAGVFGDAGLPALKFVVLGDSTAVGVGTDPEFSFPWLIASRLGQRYRVTLEVVGFGGATTKDLAVQLDKAEAAEPDLMLVEIGANDTTHLIPPWIIRQNFGAALDRLVALDGELVVAGPPDMGGIPVLLEPARSLTGVIGDNVTRIIRRQTLQRDLHYVDLAAGVERSTLPPGVPYYSSDSFHPGRGGYGLWAEVMFPAVSDAADRAVSRRAGAPGGRAEG